MKKKNLTMSNESASIENRFIVTDESDLKYIKRTLIEIIGSSVSKCEYALFQMTLTNQKKWIFNSYFHGYKAVEDKNGNDLVTTAIRCISAFLIRRFKIDVNNIKNDIEFVICCKFKDSSEAGYADIMYAIHDIPGLVYNKTISIYPTDISFAEKALGVNFSADYAHYVQLYGSVIGDGIELTTLLPNKRNNVIHATEIGRSLNPLVPRNLYVVEDPGIDGILIWQNHNGEIFESRPNKAPRMIYKSLAEYINKKNKQPMKSNKQIKHTAYNKSGVNKIKCNKNIMTGAINALYTIPRDYCKSVDVNVAVGDTVWSCEFFINKDGRRHQSEDLINNGTLSEHEVVRAYRWMCEIVKEDPQYVAGKLNVCEFTVKFDGK